MASSRSSWPSAAPSSPRRSRSPNTPCSLSDPLDGIAAQDPAGNLRPAKDKSTERIDGIVALIALMAIGRAMVAQEEPRHESLGTKVAPPSA